MVEASKLVGRSTGPTTTAEQSGFLLGVQTMLELLSKLKLRIYYVSPLDCPSIRKCESFCAEVYNLTAAHANEMFKNNNNCRPITLIVPRRSLCY